MSTTRTTTPAGVPPMTDETICKLATSMAQCMDRHTLEDIVIRDEIAFWKKEGHPVDWEFAWRAQFGGDNLEATQPRQ